MPTPPPPIHTHTRTKPHQTKKDQLPIAHLLLSMHQSACKERNNTPLH